MVEFFKALGVQSRVVHAFILRETRTRFGRSRLGYLWALFEPMAYILTLIGIYSALGRGAPIDVDITLFFFSGVIPWLMFTRMLTALSNVVDASQALLAYPHVKLLDLVVARIILEFSTLMVVAVLYLLLAGLVMGTYDGMENVAGVLGGLFMATFLGAGLGLVGSAIRLYLPAYSNFQSVLTRLLFFTSGLFFLADSLPRELREVLWYNPVLHILEWTRSAFFTGFESNFYDLRYPLFAMLILLYLGLAAERVTRRRIRQV